jgi:hypothetical protein
MSAPFDVPSHAEERPADLPQRLVAVAADWVLAAASGTRHRRVWGGRMSALLSALAPPGAVMTLAPSVVRVMAGGGGGSGAEERRKLA